MRAVLTVCEGPHLFERDGEACCVHSLCKVSVCATKPSGCTTIPGLCSWGPAVECRHNGKTRCHLSRGTRSRRNESLSLCSRSCVAVNAPLRYTETYPGWVAAGPKSSRKVRGPKLASPLSDRPAFSFSALTDDALLAEPGTQVGRDTDLRFESPRLAPSSSNQRDARVWGNSGVSSLRPYGRRSCTDRYTACPSKSTTGPRSAEEVGPMGHGRCSKARYTTSRLLYERGEWRRRCLLFSCSLIQYACTHRAPQNQCRLPNLDPVSSGPSTLSSAHHQPLRPIRSYHCCACQCTVNRMRVPTGSHLGIPILVDVPIVNAARNEAVAWAFARKLIRASSLYCASKFSQEVLKPLRVG